MYTDLIEFVIRPIGVGINEFLAKLENDPILAILLDNKWVFEDNTVYSKFVLWFFNNFELAWIGNDNIFKNFTNNKDKYLTQLLYVFTPSIHKKFYHSTKSEASPKEIIYTALNLLGTSQKTIDDILIIVNNKYKVNFTW